MAIESTNDKLAIAVLMDIAGEEPSRGAVPATPLQAGSR
jgi:hypothetical protein